MHQLFHSIVMFMESGRLLQNKTVLAVLALVQYPCSMLIIPALRFKCRREQNENEITAMQTPSRRKCEN